MSFFDLSNGILLPDSVDKITPNGSQIAHRGSQHGQYSAEIGQRVMDIKTNIPNENLAKQAIEDLQIEYEGKLQSGDVPNINKNLRFICQSNKKQDHLPFNRLVFVLVVHFFVSLGLISLLSNLIWHLYEKL